MDHGLLGGFDDGARLARQLARAHIRYRPIGVLDEISGGEHRHEPWKWHRRICAQRRQKRYNLAYRHWHDSLTQRKSFVMVKDHAPYTYGEEQKVYLNPKVRPTTPPPIGLLTSALRVSIEN